MNEHAGRAIQAGRREWIAFAVLVLPLLLVSMDVSVLYFAVPAISRELEPTAAEQLWIFDIYGFVLAGLLITMGAIGDRIGRRRLLLLGAAAFGTASLFAAYADSAAALIAARALLGLGGATIMPSTLALVRNLFLDDRQRARAIGLWTAAMTAGVALGPVISGLLLEKFWWGSVFLINIPAMVLLLVFAPVFVPESRNQSANRFDLLGALLSLAAVLPVIYGIKELARSGYSAASLAAVGVGLAVGVIFVHRQRTALEPMIDLSLFGRRAFGGAILLNVLGMFAMVGFAIFTTQYLQSVLGLSPLRAALWSVAPAVAVGAVAPLAAALAQRFDRSYVLAAGFLVAATGFGVLTQVPVREGLWTVLTGATFYAAGLVMVMSLVTELVVGSAPPERAGVASALLESGSELGGALGMALLGSIGSAVYRRQLIAPDDLPADGAAAAKETLAGALAVADALPVELGRLLTATAENAFTQSMRAAAAVTLILMVGCALLAVVILRGVRLANTVEASVSSSEADAQSLST